ncbi:MAG TPA: energy transducer TonB [Pyrinomonadaceae bacterium]|nr:energy transducer TonB [Pyrinomonadaceae bacterium]
MKRLISGLLIMLLASGCFASAGAAAAIAATAQQVASSGWVRVAPEGEKFSVLMPRSPAMVEVRKKVEGLRVSGRSYRVQDGGVIYTVWSFKREVVPTGVINDTSAYLDLCAELAWDLIVQPEIEGLRDRRDISLPGNMYALAYQRELPSPTYPGRNYLLGIGKNRGATQLYLDAERIYLVSALAAAGETARPETFMRSFSLGGASLPGAASGSEPFVSRPSPSAIRLPPFEPSASASGVGTGAGAGTGTGVAAGAGGGTGTGVGAGTGGVGAGEGGVAPGAGGVAPEAGSGGSGNEIDYTRIFLAREVTRKAQVLAKPEPSYTESARKFSVTGTVRVRVILSAKGKVSGVSVVRGLPHGLTREAVEAARAVKFKPAEKDGRIVSQYITIEYNFNIY